MSEETLKDAESIVDRLYNQQKAKKELEDRIIENVKEWQVVVDRLFQTPDGLHFAKYLIKYCGVNAPSKTDNMTKLIEQNGKRNVYVELIRPHLSKTTLIEIEQYD